MYNKYSRLTEIHRQQCVGGVMVVRPTVASLDVCERCYGGVAGDGQGRRTRDAMEAYLVARDAYLLCG
jgi:hypothetical protein